MPWRVQQPKAKVVLRCSKEGCEYTASHKRYLDAHEARYTPPPPPPSDLPILAVLLRTYLVVPVVCVLSQAYGCEAAPLPAPRMFVQGAHQGAYHAPHADAH